MLHAIIHYCAELPTFTATLSSLDLVVFAFLWLFDMLMTQDDLFGV